MGNSRSGLAHGKLRMLFTTLMLSGRAIGCAEGEHDLEDICGPVGANGGATTGNWPTIPDYFSASEAQHASGTNRGKTVPHGQSSSLGVEVGEGNPTYPGLDFPTPSPKELRRPRRPLQSASSAPPILSPPSKDTSALGLDSAGWVDF